jgi:hypothetical protein
MSAVLVLLPPSEGKATPAELTDGHLDVIETAP